MICTRRSQAENRVEGLSQHIQLIETVYKISTVFPSFKHTHVMFFQYVQSFISLYNRFCYLLFLCVCFVRSSRVICIVNRSSLDELFFS